MAKTPDRKVLKQRSSQAFENKGAHHANRVYSNREDQPWAYCHMNNNTYGMACTPSGAKRPHTPRMPSRSSSLKDLPALPRNTIMSGDDNMVSANNRMSGDTLTGDTLTSNPDASTPAPRRIVTESVLPTTFQDGAIHSATPQAYLRATSRKEPPTTPQEVHIDALTGHSDITTPAPPPRRYSLSELRDLDTLPSDSTVRSPSGNLLSIDQAKARKDRPLSIEERQRAIKRALMKRQQATGERVPERLRGRWETEIVGNWDGRGGAPKEGFRRKVARKWGEFLDGCNVQ